MNAFRFTINESFKTASTHPITVPKGQVNYTELSKLGLDKGKFTITFPKGERITGHMYSGVAGYGPYYQIRTHPDGSVPHYLHEGDKVLVLLLKDGVKKHVIIEYRE